MRARAHVVAHPGRDGTTCISRAAGEPPLVPRITGPGRVHLVGAAAGPLPGDELRLRLEVGSGATLTVAQLAATMAQPGPDPGRPWSTLGVEVDVADGGSLEFLGSPLVAVAGCRHRSRVTIRLHGDGRVLWRELLVPGRSGEATGDAVTSFEVTRDGAPVLQQEQRIGPHAPGWDSDSVVGSARCLGSMLLSGPDDWRPDEAVRWGESAILVPLAAPGSAFATAVGDAVDVQRTLEAVPGMLAAWRSTTRSG